MRRRVVTRRKQGFPIFSLLLLIALIAGGVYVYIAKEFERVPPTIQMPKYSYWNAKSPLEVEIGDDVGLREYIVMLSDGKTQVIVDRNDFLQPVQKITAKVNYPKGNVLDPKVQEIKLTVQARDRSLWNFLMGNITSKEITLSVDKTPPTVSVLANSGDIIQGGSALVIFRAEDNTGIAKVFVRTTSRDFAVQPYKKEGYYVGLFAWPFRDDNYDARVYAEDVAGNAVAVPINMLTWGRKYKGSWIKASDKFIDGKITDLAMTDPKYMKEDRLERLKAINETMRIDNENLIHKYTINVSDEMLTAPWKVNRFYPLKSGENVADFGDHRYYYYNDKTKAISESYHLGYDLASTQKAKLLSSNDGKVVFAAYNGIYGNLPIIDHGLGLYSLYGHCDALYVKEGDTVKAGDAIAATGKTGLALGDHVHFGILVQGEEVRPIEWMESNWIKKNITAVFEKADSIIH